MSFLRNLVLKEITVYVSLITTLECVDMISDQFLTIRALNELSQSICEMAPGGYFY